MTECINDHKEVCRKVNSEPEEQKETRIKEAKQTGEQIKVKACK